MGYWTGEDLPFYYSMARQFPIGDRYFCSVMAQTYPNRRFLIAATALGDVATNATGISVTDAPNGTIFDRLDRHGISWKDYYPDLPTVALFLPEWNDNKPTARSSHFEQFFIDAAAGNLPAFSLVDPYTNFSEEGNDISIGEAYAVGVHHAVLHAPAWEKTALIWTYDEHGGWYDHVPPAPAVRPDNVPPEITVPPRPARLLRLHRVPGAGGRGLGLGQAGPRLPRGARPHLHPQADRDEVEPAGPDLPRRKRQRPARLLRPGRPAAALRRPARAGRPEVTRSSVRCPQARAPPDFHPIAQAVPGQGPPPGAHLAAPPPHADVAAWPPTTAGTCLRPSARRIARRRCRLPRSGRGLGP